MFYHIISKNSKINILSKKNNHNMESLDVT